jgi:hypothetical protein
LIEGGAVTEFSSRRFPVLFRRRWTASGLADEIQKIDIDGLCTEYDRLLKAAPSRRAVRKRYFVGHAAHLQPKNPDRPSEDHLAIALSRHAEPLRRPGGGWERILDFQIPLQASAKLDAGLGKVDLLGATDQGRLVVVKLKVQRTRSSRGDAPVLALMEGLRYAAVVQANRRDIAAEARTSFGIDVSDEPPIVQILGPESWWNGWRNMPVGTRRVAGQWESSFQELSDRVEARLGVSIECVSLPGAELDDITWDARGPLLEHALTTRMVKRARDIGTATPAGNEAGLAFDLPSILHTPRLAGGVKVEFPSQPPYAGIADDLETDMGAPEEGALRSRLATLFSGDDGQSAVGTVAEVTMRDDGQQSVGHILPADTAVDEAFTVELGRSGDRQPDLKDWLCKPNHAFGGRTPESFLTGNEADRRFMDRYIGALEHGVFS